ncbi:MAG TPA: nuclear transport factor 2 family protein [Steroidobacteraceae bacterium]|nr:nuclear transport factor 2 family protein [Steroidobacteraceae bacterium]
MILLMIAAAAVAMPTTPATDAASQAVLTAYIERCETEWAMGAVRNDAEAIRRCIADDYRGFSSRGTLSTKASLLEPSEPPGKAAGLYYAKPRFMNGTTAIVQGEEWWEPKDGSGKKHLIWTDVWMFRQGLWQIVASQDSEVPFKQALLN